MHVMRWCLTTADDILFRALPSHPAGTSTDPAFCCHWRWSRTRAPRGARNFLFSKYLKWLGESLWICTPSPFKVAINRWISIWFDTINSCVFPLQETLGATFTCIHAHIGVKTRHAMLASIFVNSPRLGTQRFRCARLDYLSLYQDCICSMSTLSPPPAKYPRVTRVSLGHWKQ